VKRPASAYDLKERVAMTARNGSADWHGDVRTGSGTIGSSHSAGTLRVREFLSRNGHPFQYIDLDRDAEAQELLDRFDIAPGDIPVLLCGANAVLRNPTNARVTECLGFNETIDPKVVRDLVIVGAGPAGLAAAVYGAFDESKRTPESSCERKRRLLASKGAPISNGCVGATTGVVGQKPRTPHTCLCEGSIAVSFIHKVLQRS
jgi:hypothetical protein